MNDAGADYIHVAAALTGISLGPQREAAVAIVFARLAGFSADLHAFPLGDDVEIAGVTADAQP